MGYHTLELRTTKTNSMNYYKVCWATMMMSLSSFILLMMMKIFNYILCMNCLMRCVLAFVSLCIFPIKLFQIFQLKLLHTNKKFHSFPNDISASISDNLYFILHFIGLFALSYNGTP